MQALQRGLLGREMFSSAHGFGEVSVQAFDSIGGANDFADLGGVFWFDVAFEFVPVLL